MRKEKNQDLFFSALQSEFAKTVLKENKINDSLETMVLFQNGKFHFKSGAALRTTKYLKGLWPLMQVFLIVPAFIRNWIYDYIAKNRITWFGMADYCEMMTAELKKRFLE